jgi:hypothetical protein
VSVEVITPVMVIVRADDEEGAEATLARFLSAHSLPDRSGEHDPPLIIAAGRTEDRN